ncbi:hypothetical protein Scep_017062 [Stephania cephalantha]|uniref:UDP-glucose 6-dehydrogenase n=1 Tax=Stephania cephalantha TaxID=152367 RepID=A0AAP0INW1_9MAGN
MGLDDVVKQCRGKNLFFSTDVERHVAEADIIFVSKSTVPVKTAEAIEKILTHNSKGIKYQILSNPEFLAEGNAIKDLLNPDRVLIGGRETPEGKKAIEALANMYGQWVPKDRILATNLWSAELSKLAANAFLAQRISSVNAMSALCEATGADVSQVAHYVGTDSRICPKFLNASVGFLRFLLPKGHTQLKAKKDTGDTRETPAINVCKGLLGDNARLSIYDPPDSKGSNIEEVRLGPPNSSLANEPNFSEASVVWVAYEATKDAHGICILTEWDEFKTLDYERIFEDIQKPAFMFDWRNIVNTDKLRLCTLLESPWIHGSRTCLLWHKRET